MQREVIKWLQSLDLSNVVQNPKRDLATGHAAAEIVCRYSGTKYIDPQRLPSGVSGATKRDIWLQVYRALQGLNCQSVTPQLIDAVLRREPNAALTVLECLYEHFTGHTLPMRGLDAVGTTRNAFVQPANAASTAKLLAVAGGEASLPFKGTPSTLYDPLARASSPSGTTSAAAGAAATSSNAAAGASKQRFTADVHTSSSGNDADAADTSPSSREHAARALQHRLALIDNDELAGGANALQAYPRYARATASTLVHAASSTRKDVILDRPKYVVDETHQRAQNTRIAHQHTVVQRLQEGTSSQQQQQQQVSEGALSSSWPALGNGAGSPSSASAALPLTTVYRGKFYREPDAFSTGATKSLKGNGGGGRLPAIGGAAATAEGDEEDDDERRGGALFSGGRATDSTRPGTQEKGSRVGSAGNGRTVTKLRVHVHSTSLTTALALRSGRGQLRERAAALSRELFAKHQYRLRPALSEVLADVLGAHKQLEHVLDCSCEDGSGEVLENVLGHLLAHRQAFPMACMKACWDALSQHVEGIVATLQHTPDEYSYLIECCTFAFTREAAQVPVLQTPSSTTTLTTVMDGFGERYDGASAVEALHEDMDEAAADATTTTNAASASDRESHATENGSTVHSVASSVHSSLDKVASAATRRASEAATTSAMERDAAQRVPVLQHHQQQHVQLPLVVNARQQMDLASLFHLLSCIARQLDVATASYVLRRYVLRAAKPFVLRHGTAAVREAVAHLVSASFASATPASMENGEAAPAASDAETAFVNFLTSELALCMLPPSLSAQISPLIAAVAGDIGGRGAEEKAEKAWNASAPPTPQLSTAEQRQRAYWHVFLHAVVDFVKPASEVSGSAPPAADGPLSRCVPAAAVTCLGSSDVDVRTVGVALVGLCCECGWAESLERQESTDAPSRSALRSLITRVLGPSSAQSPLPSVGVSATPPPLPAWWNVQTSETWELRMTVLHLCTTLLARTPRGDADVRGAADAAAAACLSSFAAAASASPACSWQLHLALAEASTVIDAAHTPTMTAQWVRLLSREIAPASLSNDTVVLPSDGVDVHLLLAPLQAFGGGGKGLLPPRVPSHHLSSPTAAASQRTESPTSAGRAAKSHADARAGKRGSAQSTRTQRTARLSALGETTASLPSVLEHCDAVQLVCGRVHATYAVVPLHQVWNTPGVLDAVLPNATASGADARKGAPPVLQLHVLTAALLSTNATEDREFWCSITRRVWPLFEAEALASQAVGTHPPPVLQLRDLEESQAGAMAVLLVALFLRGAEEAAVASAVVAAGEDWGAMCAAARLWAAEAAAEPAEER